MERLVFLHLPRTGGTTFATLLKSRIGPQEVVDFSDDGLAEGILGQVSRFNNEVSVSGSDIRLVTGHIPFGAIPLCRDWQHCTIVRDPVSRLISYYDYIISQRGHYLRNYIISRRLSLDDFLLSDISSELDNFQVRVLSANGFHECDNGELEKCFETAVARIESGVIVAGVTEQLSLSTKNIFVRWGIDQDTANCYLRGESRNHAGRISQDLWAKVQHRNRFDFQLYSEVRASYLGRSEAEFQIR